MVVGQRELNQQSRQLNSAVRPTQIQVVGQRMRYIFCGPNKSQPLQDDSMKKKRQRGRPKKSARDVRQIVLKIRLSRLEYRALDHAATVELSTWAREVLLRAAGHE
jgi:hypothetical protein